MIDPAEAVARAVLYEGYLLYPYYKSSAKNRYPFQFGGLYPPAYVRANPGADRDFAAAEFLVRGNSKSLLSARLRGLQPGEGPDADERTLLRGVEERRLVREPGRPARVVEQDRLHFTRRASFARRIGLHATRTFTRA